MTRIRSESEDLLELEGDEQDPAALVALRDEAAMDELDRADVEAARRLACDEDPRVPGDLPGDHDLLLVAAGERRGGVWGFRRGRRTPSEPSGALDQAARVEPAPLRVGLLPEVVQRQVLGEREVEHEAAHLAVLGDVADARVEALARADAVMSSAPDGDLARLHLRRPVRASMSSLWPFPSTPARPDDLAPPRTRHVGRAVRSLSSRTGVFDDQERLSRLARVFSTRSTTSRPTISFARPSCVALARHGVDLLALAEDGDPIRDLEHLVQLVADEDDRLPVGLERPEDREELARLLRVRTAVGSSRMRISARR